MCVLCLTNAHTETPAVMSTTISPACLKCGIIKKSGKTSCCGRGGSWFGNCGGSGNAKLQHTWIEGILECRTRPQSKTAIGQQLNATQEKGSGSSSDGAGMTNIESVFTVSTAVHHVSHTSVSTPVVTQDIGKHSILFLISVLYLFFIVT